MKFRTFLQLTASLLLAAASTASPRLAVAQDAFEPDNQLSSAKPLPPTGVVQQRTLHLINDIDRMTVQLAPLTSTHVNFAPLAGGAIQRWRATRESASGAPLEIKEFGSSAAGISFAISNPGSSYQTFHFRVQSETYHVASVSGYRAFTGGPAPVSGPHEPNDGHRQATQLLVGQTQTHVLDIAHDNDWIYYPLAQNTTSTLTVTPVSAQSFARWRLLVYRQTPGLSTLQALPEKSVDMGTGAVTITGLDATDPQGADYYLQVKAIDGAGFFGSASAFRVSYSSTALPNNGPFEPNDTAETASSIDSGQTQSHYFDIGRDVDWIKFPVPAQGTASLSVASPTGGNSSFPWVLDVYRQLGSATPVRVPEKSTVMGTGTINITGLDADPNQATTYYLRASSNQGNFVGASTHYQVSLNIAVQAPYEPNNSAETGTSIVARETQTHALDYAGDEDWIRYWLPTNITSSLVVEPVTAGAGQAWSIEVYRALPGSQPVLMPENTRTMTSTWVRIDGLSATDPNGTGYYLRVRANAGSNFSGTNSRYRVSLSTGALGGPNEPNEIWRTATSINAQNTVFHRIDIKDDIDWSGFWLPAGGSGGFVLTPNASAPAQPNWKIDVYQQGTGQEPVWRSELSTTMANQPVTITGLNAPAQSGAGYYVLVSALSGNFSGAASEYSVAMPASTPINVALTAPSDGASFLAPASVPLAASASGGSGGIERVEFYRNNTLIHTDTESPYTHQDNNLAVGSYTYTAKAYDRANPAQSASSTAVTVTVTAPSRVVVDRSNCTLGSQACVINVEWSAAASFNGTPRLFREGPGPVFRVPVDSASGTYLDTLSTPGTYRYILRQTDSASATEIARSPDVVISPAQPVVSPYVPPTPAEMSSSDMVGATTGEFQVTASGDVTYTLPIYTAPSAGGTAPKIALGYHSGTAIGLAGVGWSLHGLSSISRCRKTVEHGDLSNPLAAQPALDLSSNDAYCLDGQRLLPVAVGPGVCANAAAEYRTEVESYQRICAFNEAGVGGGHAYFTVHSKSGVSRVYGRDAWGPTDSGTGSVNPTSRLMANAGSAPRAVITWSLGRTQDSAGNYFDYTYQKDEQNGEQLLAEVRYSANWRAAISPDHRIVFNYANLPASEVEDSRIGIASTRLSKHLTSITSLGANDAPLRDYRLRYSVTANGGRRMLLGVQECNAPGGSVCYPETQFSWTPSALGFNAVTEQSARVDGYEGLAAQKFGDINGDGLNDIVWVKRANSADPSSNPEKFWLTFTTMRNGVPVPAGARIDTGIFFADARANLDLSWHLIDYDRDGRDDLIRLARIGNSFRWLVNLSTGGGFGTTLDPNIPATSNMDVMVLSDFTGDGLSDALFTNGAGTADTQLTLRPMVAVGGFGAAIQVEFDRTGFFLPGDPGSTINTIYSVDTILDSVTRFQPFDVNADGRSDLAVTFYTEISDPNCIMRSQTGAFALSAKNGELHKSAPSYCFIPFPGVLKADGVDPASQRFVFRAHAPRLGQGCYTSAKGAVSGSLDHRSLMYADFSGDGYADVLYTRLPSTSSGANVCDGGSAPRQYAFRLNTGAGFSEERNIGNLDPGATEARDISGLQFSDPNADGRADLLFTRDYQNNQSNRFRVRYWDGSNFAGAVDLSSSAAATPWHRWQNSIVDLDNDGQPEILRLRNWCTNYPCNTWAVTGNLHARRPSQKMELIVNGLGAYTSMLYAPLSDPSVYRRGTGTSALQFGRGSPVFDLQGSIYVLKRAQSSAPIESDPNAGASVQYFYVGGRMQGGGRGFLGFEETHIYTDPQISGVQQQRILNIQRTHQSFPLIGTGKDSTQELVNVDINGLKTSLERSLATSNTTYHSSALTNPPAPVVVLPLQQTSRSFELTSGSLLTHSVTDFSQYDVYGNVLNMSVSEFDSSGARLRTVTTVNQFSMEDPHRWLLGRLMRSEVTHEVVGLPLVTRVSSFAYDVFTGLLREEVIEPEGGSAEMLRKTYALDFFGNRRVSATCSNHYATRTDCLTTAGMASRFDPDSQNDRVKRVTRQAFDSRGRFPIEQYVWASQAASSNATEVRVSWSQEGDIDRFGNTTRSFTVNGGIAQAQFGALGREHARWSNDGSAIETRYSWCSSVSCPLGMAYRMELRVRGGARSWTYHDVLGRERVKLTEGFSDPTDPEAAALGFTVNQFVAVRSEYDLLGRAWKVSEPYFAQGPAASDPAAALVAGSQFWTTTVFDAAGRVTRINHPEAGAYTATSFNGLSTVTRTRADAASNEQTRTEIRNHLGQLIETIDAQGMRVCNRYDHQGRLATVDQGSSCLNPNPAMRMSVTYNKVGHRLSVSDPNKGTWSYLPNAMGETIEQTDAKGQRIRNSYDNQGRVWRRMDLRVNGTTEEITSWQYDTAANGIGSLAMEVQSLAGYSKTHAYDALGRPSTQTVIQDGSSYVMTTSYDGLGRIELSTDASGEAVRTEYTARGHVKRLREAAGSASGTVINEVRQVNARGQVEIERRGGLANLTTQRSYWPATGRLQSIVSAAGSIQHLYYEWDWLGNLRMRRDQSAGADLEERFDYDSLNRLLSVHLSRRAGGTPVTNQLTLSMAYDAYGNITNKSDVGSYQYGGMGCGRQAGPHAVSSAGTSSYCYDANGNQTSGDNRSINYSVFDKPTSIVSGSDTISFAYGSGRELIKRVDGNGSAVTRFVGNVEILVNENATRRSVAGMLVKRQGTQRQVHYVFSDHLGSVSAIVAADGTVSQRQSFDAHGARRLPANWEAMAAADQRNFDTSLTKKGFTNHEGIERAGLIHFGGRLYDPRLGRFIQADPFVEDANLANGLNRYSYVLNNPLSLTDPSGYLSWREVRPFVAMAVAAFLNPALALGNSFWSAVGISSQFTATVLTGAISGAISGGARGAVLGAFEAGLNFGIGRGIAAASGTRFAKAVASVALHSVRGGVMNILRGGDWSSGMARAGLTEALSPLAGLAGDNDAMRYVITAVIGGTVDEVTGGKFANGATSAVFALAFNHMADRKTQTAKDVRTLTKDEALAVRNAALNMWGEIQSLYAEGPEAFLEKYPDYRSGGDPGDAALVGLWDLRAKLFELSARSVQQYSRLEAKEYYEDVPLDIMVGQLGTIGKIGEVRGFFIEQGYQTFKESKGWIFGSDYDVLIACKGGLAGCTYVIDTK